MTRLLVPHGYSEHAPPAALRAFVQCLWTRSTPWACMTPPAHRVLPDGCVDLILTSGSWWSSGPASPHAEERFAGGGAPVEAPEISFVGTMTTALVVRPQPGTAFVGARCRPGAARALLGVPAEELTDQRVAAGDLWTDPPEWIGARGAPEWIGAPPSSKRKGYELFEPTGGHDPLRTIAQALLLRFAGAAPPPADVLAAVSAIRRARGSVRIAALCAGMGVTRQHLARTFREHVGVSPKMFARVERMRNAVRLARTSRTASWSRIAIAAGFADQSHMIGDFHELVGVAPDRWLAES